MYQVFIILACSLISISNAKSTHVYSIYDAPLQTTGSLGNIAAITSKEFPILKRLSIRRLILETSTVREPHWHANAHELTYCVVSFKFLFYLNSKKKETSFFFS